MRKMIFKHAWIFFLFFTFELKDVLGVFGPLNCEHAVLRGNYAEILQKNSGYDSSGLFSVNWASMFQNEYGTTKTTAYCVNFLLVHYGMKSTQLDLMNECCPEGYILGSKDDAEYRLGCNCPQLDGQIKHLNITKRFQGIEPFKLNICGEENLVIISVFYDDWYDYKGFNNYRFIFDNIRNCTEETPVEIFKKKELNYCEYLDMLPNYRELILDNSGYNNGSDPNSLYFNWALAFSLDSESGLSYATCLNEVYFYYGIRLKDLRYMVDCCPWEPDIDVMNNSFKKNPAWTIKKGKCECSGLNIRNKTANILIDGIQPVRLPVCGEENVVIVSFFHGYHSEWAFINKRFIIDTPACVNPPAVEVEETGGPLTGIILGGVGIILIISILIFVAFRNHSGELKPLSAAAGQSDDKAPPASTVSEESISVYSITKI
ncbi:uncharacterized protein LOC111695557 [Eurytemora carolleeae]|uniref:uncharacterized protein LOC111695557 n=1 Tax=Eurytemora carolleeae TaxID=1294199 RepID=UPI000C7681E6|nr:uncharacterized protein LOC111695557 [Eurytemora carolleeae]|eukprot:XP_023320690.1 uncharacterized protein LOC111695557 [Eurytemora affinis]